MIRRGPQGTRGELAVWRTGLLRWNWSICIGGSSWTDPQQAHTPYVRRRALRHIRSIPNRANRRAINTLQQKHHAVPGA